MDVLGPLLNRSFDLESCSSAGSGPSPSPSQPTDVFCSDAVLAHSAVRAVDVFGPTPSAAAVVAALSRRSSSSSGRSLRSRRSGSAAALAAFAEAREVGGNLLAVLNSMFSLLLVAQQDRRAISSALARLAPAGPAEGQTLRPRPVGPGLSTATKSSPDVEMATADQKTPPLPELERDD